MDIADARRQVAEINTLLDQPKYAHMIEITTPALLGRLERAVGATCSDAQTLPVKKCLSLSINCRELDIDELEELVLEVEFPLDYPSASNCSVRAINNGEDAPSVSERIQTYLQPFVGCECLELILDWLSDNRSTCLSCNNKNVLEDTAGKIQCYVLRFNHLLSGPEHKKEKAMVDAAKKMKLQGGLLWGTPGIVVVVSPSTEEDAKEFSSESRDVGKRPDGVEAMHLPERGVEEAGLGGLAQQKRGGKLQSLDTAMLRTACGGDEDLLRSVLGVR